MTPLDIAILVVATVLSSALTAVVGAGGGTFLLALMLLHMPPAEAIPAHGVVQMVSNIARTWLLRRHLAWPIVWRFTAPLPAGSALGLWLFHLLPEAVVRILIGGMILLTLALQRLRRMRERDMPIWGFVPLGFVTGALNMIVGVIGPVLGAFMVRKDLRKEQIVGTLGLFGVAGNLVKLVGFTLAGASLGRHAPLLAAMSVAGLFGNVIGRHVLDRLDEQLFRLAFQAVLIGLAAKLILVDGLGLL